MAQTYQQYKAAFFKKEGMSEEEYKDMQKRGMSKEEYKAMQQKQMRGGRIECNVQNANTGEKVQYDLDRKVFVPDDENPYLFTSMNEAKKARFHHVHNSGDGTYDTDWEIVPVVEA